MVKTLFILYSCQQKRWADASGVYNLYRFKCKLAEGDEKRSSLLAFKSCPEQRAQTFIGQKEGFRPFPAYLRCLVSFTVGTGSWVSRDSKVLRGLRKKFGSLNSDLDSTASCCGNYKYQLFRIKGQLGIYSCNVINLTRTCSLTYLIMFTSSVFNVGMSTVSSSPASLFASTSHSTASVYFSKNLAVRPME